MLEAPRNIRRRVVPRWRRVKNTPSSELSALKTETPPKQLQSEFGALLHEWRTNRTIVTASELLFASSLGMSDDGVFDAASFLINSADVSPRIKRFAATRLPQVKQESEAQSTLLHNLHIQDLKKRVFEYPRNSLAHVELARAYLSKAQLRHAWHHLRIALNLSPTNRFVLRSVARFDVHRGSIERSIKTLEEMAAYDPWVAATFVSLNDLSGKSIQRIKPIRELLERTENPLHRSELAASLGTLELKSAGIRKARKYFQIASLAPNENVVAQLFWLSKNYGVNFDKRLLEDQDAFEAQAKSSSETEDWPEAVSSCWHWLENEPFSIRPAIEGGFIAAEMMGDFGAAIDFARCGLQSNPKSLTLINNLAYAYIMEGNLVDGALHLQRAKSLGDKDEEHKALLQATEGLLLYRQGHVNEGAQHYIATILKAKELKLPRMVQLAYIHFCYEELRIGHAAPGLSLDDVSRFYTGDIATKDSKAAYRKLLQPMLEARRKYGLVETGYMPALPLLSE